jgi:hypothetical protein
MPSVSYEIALYNSPVFEELISEFYRISKYKRNIYKKIKNVDEFNKKLSAEERSILEDLSAKENKIILEILVNKNWLSIPSNDSKNITSSNFRLEEKINESIIERRLRFEEVKII